ncbi:MAG: hypothetical protein SFV21_14685 [Rhodospirillaceae bacterium]|nr:hypothetical protein [Rhodospirillaceae bacterium]
MRTVRTVIVVAALLAHAGSAWPQTRASEVLIPAGPFHGVHGLAFAADGTLLAADIMGMTVHAVNVANGARRVLVGPTAGMADDVAVAPPGTPNAGTVVWTGVAVGRLYARDTSGKVRVVAENLPAINTVGFAPDGPLYATQFDDRGNVLWRIDLSGGGAHEKVWEDTKGLNGFVIAPDGYLYGPQADLGRVIRLDLNTLDIKVIATGFTWPTGVKMDLSGGPNDGTLYAVDFEAGALHRIDKGSGAVETLAMLEPGLDNLAVGPNGKVYVSSITRNGIFEVDPATRIVRAVAQGALTAPGGVAVVDGASESRGPLVFVADMFSLRAIDGRTGAMRTLAWPGKVSLYPSNVSAAVLNGRPAAVVTSWFTGTLAVLDGTSGEVLRRETGLAQPHDTVMLADGAILVAETGAKRLTHVAPDGARTARPMVFNAPVGLALAANGAVFVTDAGTGQVLRSAPPFDAVTVVAGGLGRPEGIAVMPDGRLAVVDSARGEVAAIDPATGAKDELVTLVALIPTAPAPFAPTWIHNGVAAGADGTLYLPSDRQAALYRIVTKR